MSNNSTRIFAKLFNYSDIGQVLIQSRFSPIKNAPVIEVTVAHKDQQLMSITSFTNDEEGFDNRDEFFEQIDERVAYGQGRALLKDLVTIKEPKSKISRPTLDEIVTANISKNS